MRSLLVLLVALLVSPLAWAQEQAFANRSTEVKDRAALDARTLGELREGTEVKVVQRAGGWARVEGGGMNGWVRVFHLRFPATTQAASSSGFGSFFSSAAGAIGGRERTKTTTIATTGIRGLSPEDLKNANPDPAALRQMQSYRADKPAAERFAREGKLRDVQVEDEGGRR